MTGTSSVYAVYMLVSGNESYIRGESGLETDSDLPWIGSDNVRGRYTRKDGATVRSIGIELLLN